MIMQKQWIYKSWRDVRILPLLIFALITFISRPLPAYAGAWNQLPGDGVIISGYDYSKASRIFSDNGRHDDINEPAIEFSKSELRLYYEHGISKNITAVINGAHQTVQFNGPNSQINFKDFGDIELGLRYQIARRKNTVFALQASYIIGGGPQSSILDINGPRDSFELRGLVGHSKDLKGKNLKDISLFFDTQLAVRVQSSNQHQASSGVEALRGDLTLGVKRKEALMLLGQLFYAKQPSQSSGGFTVQKQSSTKLRTSIVYKYKKNRSVQLGYQSTIAGRNIVKESGVTIGTWLAY